MPTLPSPATRPHPTLSHVPDEAKKAAQGASGEATKARGKPSFQRLARLGIGARAAIYVLLAFMAADIALTHHSPSQPSSSGALAELAKQPLGRPLLAVLALGLFGYALWRLSQALAPDDARNSASTGAGPGRPNGEGTSGGSAGAGHGWQARLKARAYGPGKEAEGLFQRVGRGAIAVVYFGLCGRAVALAVSSAASSGGGASSHPQPLVATVLRWPGGPAWVGLVGTGIGVAGVVMTVWGCVHDYAKTFDRSRLRGARFQLARATGIFGDATRGALVALIGVYLLLAAVHDNPAQAKSLGGALYSFDHLSAGPALLLLAAAGLASFAAYSVFEALFRKV